MMRRKALRTLALAASSTAVGYGARWFEEKWQAKRITPPPLRWHTNLSTLAQKDVMKEQLKDRERQCAMQLHDIALIKRFLNGYSIEVNQLLFSAYSFAPSNPWIGADYALSCLAQVDKLLNDKDVPHAMQWLDKTNKLLKEIPEAKESNLYIAIGYHYQRSASIVKDKNQKIEFLKKAVNSYQTAHKLEPKSKVIICLIGEGCLDLAPLQEGELQSGAFRQAVKHFRQAISVDEKYGLAHFRLGETYLKWGEIEAGKKEIIRALEIYLEASKQFPQEFQGENGTSFFNQIPTFYGRESFIDELKAVMQPKAPRPVLQVK